LHLAAAQGLTEVRFGPLDGNAGSRRLRLECAHRWRWAWAWQACPAGASNDPAKQQPDFRGHAQKSGQSCPPNEAARPQGSKKALILGGTLTNLLRHGATAD
jgi:hypothetical protein